MQALGDTVFVYDADQQRVSGIGPDGTVTRSAVMPMSVFRFLPIAGGQYVINPVMDTTPLHIVDERGASVISFGADATLGPVYGRALAPADSVSFWAAARQHYLIERWSYDGVKLRTIRREASWFPGSAVPTGYHPDTIPDAQLLDIRAEGDRLWTLIRVADARWPDAVVLMPGGGTNINDMDRAYDTIIEVLDVRDGQVLHSQRFDPVYYRFLADGRITGQRRDEHHVHVSINRPRILENAR